MSLVEIFEDDDGELRERDLVHNPAVRFLETHAGMQIVVVILVVVIVIVVVVVFCGEWEKKGKIKHF